MAEGDEVKIEDVDAVIPPLVQVKNLTLKLGTTEALRNVTFELPAGARCLLLGANGAGKSTLLRVLNGLHLHPHGAAQVLGRSAFHDTSLNIERAYLANNFARQTVAFSGYSQPLHMDIAVRNMMKDLQAAFPERRDMLVKLLRIDLDWRLHQISDGQRRRVQIMLQLLRPVSFVCLDEITTDLDLLTRIDFLKFIRQESIERGVAVVYATHIFDALQDWATHIAFMRKGEVVRFGQLAEFPELQKAPLLQVIEDWMRADREATEKEGGKWESSVGVDGDSMFGGNGNVYAPGRFYDCPTLP